MLTRCGKNLLPKLQPHSGSLNGLSYTIADDGTVTVSGTTTANVNIPIHGTYASVENVFPGLRSKELFALNVTVRITNPETETNRYTGGAITLADDEFISYVYMTWPSGSTYSGQKYYPSITLGHAAPVYEPYHGSTFALDFGKNLCPGFESGAYAVADGAPMDSTNYQRTKKIPITEGTVYAHSTSKEWPPTDIHFWDKDGNWLGAYADLAKLNDRPAGAAFVAFNYYQQGITWVQVEIGSSPTFYVPYNATLTAQTGGMIYSGTLDWNKGEMVVDIGGIALDGTEGWTLQNDKYYVLQDSSLSLPSGQDMYCISSHFKSITWLEGDNSGVIGVNGTYGIRAYVMELFPTLDAWKAFLSAQHAADTPVQVCYKLATPVNISLTPLQITALAGLNTVYSDADEMTVDFNRDNYVPHYSLENIGAASKADLNALIARIVALEAKTATLGTGDQT